MTDILPQRWEDTLSERRKEIGRRIREQRKDEKRMSQDEFAEKLTMLLGCEDIAQNTISDWERGKSIPPLDRLLAMSKIFECDCGYLLGDYKTKTHNSLEICQKTGLSEKSVQHLCFENTWGFGDAAEIIDFLLEDDRARDEEHHFRSILNLLHFFLNYDGTGQPQKQVHISGVIRDHANTGFISSDAIRIDDEVIEYAVLMEIQQALISLKKIYKRDREKQNNG